MRWPWQRRSHPEPPAAGPAWQPPLGTGPWRTWYAECCDTLLAYHRVTATLPSALRDPATDQAEQLRTLLDGVREIAELGARLDPQGPWPDPRLAALLAQDAVADLHRQLPEQTATRLLAELIEQRRQRLEEIVDELTRLAAQALENPAATDVADWLGTLAEGITEATRAGWASSTLPRQRLRPAPRAVEVAAIPPPAEPRSTAGLEWYAEPVDERTALGLPEPPDVVPGLRLRCLVTESAVLRYRQALGTVPPDSPAGRALVDGWPRVLAQLARVHRLALLADRAPWYLPAPRRRAPRRTRHPAAARHLHNLHGAMLAVELSAHAAVRIAVVSALSGAQPVPGADTDAEHALAALANALVELSHSPD